MSKENTSQELKKGIQTLENNIGYFPSDSCERTVLRVLRDTKVQEAFVELINDGYDFFNYECRPIGFNPNKKVTMVTFYFICRPPRICIVHPRLEVIYDHSEDKVLEVRTVFTS
jgi:hypothetical protein